ncbi:MAG: aminotransferase class I and II [Muribaculaceae bacterium]|nr:aminotransferase class I and II [Muribaculaceae bacterium]
MEKLDIRHQHLERYILPLREGGSLPALAEADDGFRYVVKFRGAGHGNKALVAEFIGGEIARAAGMNVPEIVFVDIDEDFGRTEGDEEIQDLLKASRGLNLGLHFLNGAITYDPAVNSVDPVTASRVVWLDAFLTNVDRTARNTNMLMWHNNRELWLIDHGATLYFHHNWDGWEKAALSPFPYIKDHVLLPVAGQLREADEQLKELVTPELIERVVNSVPDEWLIEEGSTLTPDDRRRVYIKFLTDRLAASSSTFVSHAIDAREKLV